MKRRHQTSANTGPFGRTAVSPTIEGAGFPGVDVAGPCLGDRVAALREDGRGGPLDLRRRVDGAAYDPYDANVAHRIQISLGLGEIRDWLEGKAKYKQLRLITSGVAGSGQSFVIHVLTGPIRTLLGIRSDAQVYAPTGVAAFLVGGLTAHRLLRIPTGKKEYGHLDPLKGEAIRLVQGNCQNALFL